MFDEYYARIIGVEEPFVANIRYVHRSDGLMNYGMLIYCVAQELEVNSFFKIDYSNI